MRLACRLPEEVQRRIAGPEQRNDEGAPLDPAVQLVLTLQGYVGVPPLHAVGVSGARAELDRSSALVAGRFTPLHRVEDGTLPGAAGPLPVRWYRHRDARALLVWFHGGGFVCGSLASHDALCRRFAARSGLDVVAVDYRLAPEARFPAAVEDALAVWEAARGRAERVGVGGDSAGGNLAAVICQQAEAKPAGQLLVYPACDMRRIDPSHRLFADGYFLTSETIDFFLAHYGPDVEDPRASPVLATELAGLPPAVVHVAGFDPLRDEGRRYAAALQAAGVPVVLRQNEGMIHGFANMLALPGPRAAVDVLAADLAALAAG